MLLKQWHTKVPCIVVEGIAVLDSSVAAVVLTLDVVTLDMLLKCLSEMVACSRWRQF